MSEVPLWWPDPTARNQLTTPGPSWGYFKSQFWTIFSSFGDCSPQIGSITVPKSQNRSLGYPHEVPFVGWPEQAGLHCSLLSLSLSLYIYMYVYIYICVCVYIHYMSRCEYAEIAAKGECRSTLWVRTPPPQPFPTLCLLWCLTYPEHCAVSLVLSSTEVSDTNVYEPSIRARLEIAAHFCRVFSLKLLGVPLYRSCVASSDWFPV